MGAVFEAQFQNLRESFGRRGRDVQVARDRAGHPLYLYEVGRVLIRVDAGDAFVPVRDRLRARGIEVSEQQIAPGLVFQDTAGQDVPDLLDDLDRSFGPPRPGRSATPGPAAAVIAPNYAVGITKICPAGEPAVPEGDAAGPWPPQEDPSVTGRFPVMVGVSDTGLVLPVDVGRNPWLGPVGIAVVKNILSPQTIGVEKPRPAIGIFHLRFLVSLLSVGAPPRATPLKNGPRHCGQ